MPSPSPNQKLNEMFEKTCNEIAKDMPLLFHSAGVNCTDENASLLASLTVQYMSSMVEQAVKTCDYQFPKRAIIPTFKKRKAPPRNLDDPLPMPKIRKRSLEEETKQQKTVTAPWDEENDDTPVEPVDETAWVGVSGVDVWETNRRALRTNGLHSAHFVFLVCHDTYMYGKICQLKNAKNTLNVLEDPVIRDTIVEQGLEEKRLHQPAKPKKKKAESDEEDDDEDEDTNPEAVSDDDEETPAWPNLDRLLPAYRNFDTT